MRRVLVTKYLNFLSKVCDMLTSKVTFTNRLRIGYVFGYAANRLVLLVLNTICNLVTKIYIYSINSIGKIYIYIIPYIFRDNTRARLCLQLQTRRACHE